VSINFLHFIPFFSRTCSCLFAFVFNEQEIKEITITDHYQQKSGRENITNELILDILKVEINNKRFFPTDYPGTRKISLREIPFKGKKYRLIFWFKDNNNNHL
jgi:hypothetical protein